MKAYHGDAWAAVIIRKEITFDERNDEEIFLDGSNNASILVNTIGVQELIQLVCGVAEDNFKLFWEINNSLQFHEKCLNGPILRRHEAKALGKLQDITIISFKYIIGS